MREILSRGQCIDTKEWVVGYHCKRYVNIGGVSFLEDCIQVVDEKNKSIICYGVDPETVSQFTGLLDKNGKMIFEGDCAKQTISYGDRDDDEVIGVVRYGLDIDKWYGTEYLLFDTKFSKVEFDRFWTLQSDCEVIGNIFDKIKYNSEELFKDID